MAFTTQTFLFLFLPICLILHRFVLMLEKWKPTSHFSKRLRLRDVTVILLSAVFFSWACFDNLFRLIAYVIVIYAMGRILDVSKKNKFYIKLETDSGESSKARRIYLSSVWLFIIIAAVIFYLAYYKYSNYMAAAWNFAFGDSVKAHELFAPLGLSFITFSAISYLVDIYRCDAPTGSFTDCALYLMFFPKLVSGPIVLWKNFRNQAAEAECCADLDVRGINRIISGFAKKVILADTFGACIAEISGGVDAVTAAGTVLLYMLQIYYDFSGYSDIAIGVSNLLGFRFENNFNFPYRSKSVTEFWRRWHISLGMWFKEYVYIPLGGSRVNLKTTLRNLFIVFLLTGIWHGRAKAYIVWGLINAALVMLERVIRDKKLYKNTPDWVKYICTMLIVMGLWQLFRFESVSDALGWMEIALGIDRIEGIYYTWQYYFDRRVICFAIIGILGATVFGAPRIRAAYSKISSTRTGFAVQELVLLAVFAVSILFTVSSTYSPFIYFRY